MERAIKPVKEIQTALLAPIVLFFIAALGCMAFSDLPHTREVSQVPEVPLNEEPQATKSMTDRQLVEPVPLTQPVRRKNLHVVQRRIDTSQLRYGSVGEQAKAAAHVDPISAEPFSLKQYDVAGPTISRSNRVEKFNFFERDNLTLAASEVILFLVVGSVFVLVHVSRRRPPASPDTPLAKLLHTRPWR